MENNNIVCKGFIAGILTDKEIGECSNNGISHWANEVTIVTDNQELQVFETEPKDELRRPIVKIVKRIICGEEYIHAEPIDDPQGVGWMAGGSYIWSCDSRFRQHINAYPIPLHDRQETQKEYDRNFD